jgi:hypothetical protein
VTERIALIADASAGLAPNWHAFRSQQSSSGADARGVPM